jgi:antitoxin MazE
MGTTLAKVRRIGNSKGILFPKAILEESGIKDMVEIKVKDNTILISSAPQKSKKTWSDFKRAKKEKATFVANDFDSTDWAWQ